MEGKFEDLHHFLGEGKTAMDVIAITETTEDKEDYFTTNVEIEDYSCYSPYKPIINMALLKMTKTAKKNTFSNKLTQNHARNITVLRPSDTPCYS